MDRQKRIFRAGDHAILRDGLQAMLAVLSDCEIVGEAEKRRESYARSREQYVRPGNTGPFDAEDEWHGGLTGERKAFLRSSHWFETPGYRKMTALFNEPARRPG